MPADREQHVTLRWAAVLALGAVACAGGAPATPATAPTEAAAPDDAAMYRMQIERETTLLEDLSKRGCACAEAACLTNIDDELAAYYREATVNDPVTEVETWPADLDARGQAALESLIACSSAAGVVRYSTSVLFVRKLALFRDAMCACTSRDCREHVRGKALAFGKRAPEMASKPEVSAEILALTKEIVACIEGVPGAEQAVLALKVIREVACECVDQACVADVIAQVAAHNAQYAGARSTPEIVARVLAVADEIEECLRAVPAD